MELGCGLQIGPVQFQPSEVARLLLAGFVAILPLRSPSPGRRAVAGRVVRSAARAVPAAAGGAVLAAVAVLVFQNDLGMAALVVLGAYALVASVLSSKSSLGSAGAILDACRRCIICASRRECVTALPRGWSPGTIRPDEVSSLFRQNTVWRRAVSSGRASPTLAGSRARGAYRLHPGGGRHPMGLVRRGGGAWAGEHHRLPVCCRCIARHGRFSLLVGAGDCRPVRHSGAADLWWHLASLAADRAQPAARFVRRHVDGRNSLRARHRGRASERPQTSRAANRSGCARIRGAPANLLEDRATLRAVASHPEGCLHCR